MNGPMSLSLSVALVLLTCISLCQALATYAADGQDSSSDRVSNLLRTIDESDGYDDQAKFLDLKLTAAERHSLASLALKSDRHTSRLLGTVLAIGIADPEERHRLLKIALCDRSRQVVRVAWLAAFLSNCETTLAAPEEILESRDSILRAAYAAWTDDVPALAGLSFDRHKLVRAVVARRLGTLYEQKSARGEAATLLQDGKFCFALDVLLQDREPLVRANALLAARQSGHVTAEVLRGLVNDRQPFVSISEISGDSAAVQAVRGQFGLSPEVDWDSTLLGMLLTKKIWPVSPSPQGRIVLVEERPLIGTIAADGLLDLNPEEARQFLTWIMEHMEHRPLRGQLSMLLE